MKIVSCSNAKNFVNSLKNTDDIIYNQLSSFEDGEINIKIPEAANLQDEDVLIIQSISNSVNDAFMELIFTINIVRNSLPRNIYILLTYMGYSRQDRITSINEAFSCQILANLLSYSFVKRIFLVDIHAEQSIGFFNIPAINIKTDDFIINLIKEKYTMENSILVSPDIGNVKTIIKLADALEMEYAVAIKYRPEANQNKILSITGANVENKNCIIVDDIIDSAGTLCNVAEKLTKQGANDIVAFLTHPVLSPKSIERIKNSYITKIYVGDTIPCEEKIDLIGGRIEVFSIANFILDKVKKSCKINL